MQERLSAGAGVKVMSPVPYSREHFHLRLRGHLLTFTFHSILFTKHQKTFTYKPFPLHAGECHKIPVHRGVVIGGYRVRGGGGASWRLSVYKMGMTKPTHNLLTPPNPSNHW